MGLDMWIYSGVKPVEERIPKHPFDEDLYKLGYTYFTLDKGNKDLYEDILPICIEIKGSYIGTDWKKFREDYNVPEEAVIRGYRLDFKDSIFRFYLNDKSYAINISNEDLNKYNIIVDTDFLITDLKEISYFRKEYDLQENIYEVYKKYSGKEIKNCGYYHLTKEMISELNEINDLFFNQYFSEDNDTLYYHEWY